MTFPKYRSHKVVEAFKIGHIYEQVLVDRYMLVPINPTIMAHSVPISYVVKHKPKVGGYWVRYEDGYESWSPAEAFEKGYTRIEE